MPRKQGDGRGRLGGRAAGTPNKDKPLKTFLRQHSVKYFTPCIEEIDEKGKKHYLKRSKYPVKSVKRCCCCGKELSVSDMNYYDLTNYCPKCALADGIITSLE